MKVYPCVHFRLEHPIQEGDAWGENEDDNDYYNDNPRAQPPSPKHTVPSEYSSPPSNLPVCVMFLLLRRNINDMVFCF